MLIFFQNAINKFDFRKIGPKNLADGEDVSRVAAQKQSDFLTRIESAQINPKSKNKFRRECALILQKNNPLEKLHDLGESLQKYEEFVLGIRTSFLYARDGLLAGEIEEIPFWGGRGVIYENETLPSEVIKEKIFWLREFVDPLYDEQTDPAKIGESDLSEGKQKMSARMDQMKNELEKRKKQVLDFLAAREKYPDLAKQFKTLFSKKVFARSTFAERRNILLRISDQVRIVDSTTDFLEIQETDFEDELQTKIFAAEILPPSEAWVIYKNEEEKMRRPPKQLKRLEIFKKWATTFQLAREKCEHKIETQLAEIQKNLAKKKNASVLKKDLDFIAALNPQFKIATKFPIELELQLLEKLKLFQNGEEHESKTTSIRENLFLAQKNNEFIRRMFLQIAALAMAMGRTSTASETQKQIVKKDAVADESLEEGVSVKLQQAAAQKTTREILGTKATKNVDTLAAMQDSEAIEIKKNEDGFEAGIAETAQSAYQTESWEMTRLIGIEAWPPHQLQEYLQTVRRSGHHLEITDNYLAVSFLFAANLLKQRVVGSLSDLPGQTAQENGLYQQELFKIIDSAQKADDDFSERIFAYTPSI